MLKKVNLSFVAIFLGAGILSATGQTNAPATTPVAPSTVFGTPEPTPPGPITPSVRTDLFNGKDMTGWKFVYRGTPPSPETVWSTIWTVKDGVIHYAGDPKINVQTLAAYRDYKLHVEWRWPEGPGNSGVFLNVSSRRDVLTPVCIEAQLMAQHAGDLRTDGGAKWIPNADPAVRPRQKDSSEKPPGEWNTYDILCKGDAFTVWVNGVLQNEVQGASVTSGPIALQAEGKAIEFRNIWIEPLPKP